MPTNYSHGLLGEWIFYYQDRTHKFLPWNTFVRTQLLSWAVTLTALTVQNLQLTWRFQTLQYHTRLSYRPYQHASEVQIWSEFMYRRFSSATILHKIHYYFNWLKSNVDFVPPASIVTLRFIFNAFCMTVTLNSDYVLKQRLKCFLVALAELLNFRGQIEDMC